MNAGESNVVHGWVWYGHAAKQVKGQRIANGRVLVDVTRTKRRKPGAAIPPGRALIFDAAAVKATRAEAEGTATGIWVPCYFVLRSGCRNTVHVISGERCERANLLRFKARTAGLRKCWPSALDGDSKGWSVVRSDEYRTGLISDKLADVKRDALERLAKKVKDELNSAKEARKALKQLGACRAAIMKLRQ